MPGRIARPCTYPGCGKLTTDKSGRCDAHPRASWAKGADAPKRVRGRRLQEMRRRLFQANPLCAECERQGRISLATERDHIKPLSQGGEDVDSNIQGLCRSCHEAKSLKERRQG